MRSIVFDHVIEFCAQSARLFDMKNSAAAIEHLGKFERLQLAEDLWDEFAAQADSSLEPEVLQELSRRAAWRDAHPGQGKSLAEIAQSLGVHTICVGQALNSTPYSTYADSVTPTQPAGRFARCCCW